MLVFFGQPRQTICETRFWQSYIHELVPTSTHTAASFFTDKQVAENCLGKAALEGKIKMHSYKKTKYENKLHVEIARKILLENWQRYQFGDRLLFWLLRFQPKSIPTKKERNPHGMQKHVNKYRWWTIVGKIILTFITEIHFWEKKKWNTINWAVVIYICGMYLVCLQSEHLSSWSGHQQKHVFN